MDFNNDQNEPQNQQNSNMSYQPKKGTFFKKKIVYGFFIFVILLIILLTFRKEIFSSEDTDQNNKKIIKTEVAKENESPDLDNVQYGEEDMQDLGYGENDENDENGGLTDEELNYVIPGDDEENQNNVEPQKSTEEPTIEKGYKNSKTNINSTYFYNENDSYRIPTRAGYISTIILSPDEDIIHAEIGDATRWSIQTYYTGTSRGMSPAISIKPFIPELKTNLVISTTKRMYNLVLEAKVNSYAPVISFEYPKEIEIAKQKERSLKAQETKVNVNNLNFEYTWNKNKETWSPVQIFDDGEQTFIVMGEKVKATELPILFIKDEQTGEGASVRHRYDPETRYYTVDRLFKQAYLRYGEKEIIT